MLVLGLSGGADLIHEDRRYLFPYGEVHDSAAVLVDDGKVIAAVEEERLNRVKHTGKAPLLALQYCLSEGHVSLNDIDAMVVAGEEQLLGKMIRRRCFGRAGGLPAGPRDLIHHMLQAGMGNDIDDSKLEFVHHHLAHAVSAYVQSGFDEALVFTADGGGDDIAGMVLTASGGALEVLRRTPMQKSLGLFYLKVIGYLGYGLFDEYKVMGLAPYGDPTRYRDLFRSFYDLLPDGEYVIKLDMPDDLLRLGPPRKKGEPFNQLHKDIAASLQNALEDLVFHVMRHFRQSAKQSKLCLAGGVAHNCTLNGKLMYSVLFDKIFVQPASHDGGLALGAALHPFLMNARKPNHRAIDHVYWGPAISNRASVSHELKLWEEFLEFEYADGIADRAAKLLAEGSVIGWVQGRSEFGPRALGNRSIVADPRPAENKDIINQMVKKREGYRPFAPSVLEEHAREYFDLPERAVCHPFMTFVVKVQPQKRALLGAITHVDGTARIHTVSKLTNRPYWDLLESFRKLTGIPLVLNTSFNNNAEPIVDSAEDAIVCFLTTGLDYLVLGNYLVARRNVDLLAYTSLVPALQPYAQLVRTVGRTPASPMTSRFEIVYRFAGPDSVGISENTFDLLTASTDQQPVLEIASLLGWREPVLTAVVRELLELWARRAVTLRPCR